MIALNLAFGKVRKSVLPSSLQKDQSHHFVFSPSRHAYTALTCDSAIRAGQKLLEGLHLVVDSGCTKGLFPESFRRFVVKSMKNTTSFNTAETLSGKKKGKLTTYENVVLTIPTMNATSRSVYTVWKGAMIKGDRCRALVPALVGYCKNTDHFITPVKTIPGFSKPLRGPIINGLTVFPAFSLLSSHLMASRQKVKQGQEP
uniref:Uncharacterized protein n=1 Tax=Chromera velia CCMP2878 TaxID=1169474 RepID=A0A0G4FBN3_9ALVE|eukprot:Cvel_16222.t1-p1 / transcript=Cvel_16222.t1 / gene=Cvel_16222 / organism=Chromera_velia_CCMP2878 / gene_product=hypothetical protein / transcript_product=hypothetical protein / location=Cvel_scaffold1240:15630-16229(-) / protein_length=200 / sequence_SO=supercontig / SO=protein_coding / is_pseudo=false